MQRLTVAAAARQRKMVPFETFGSNLNDSNTTPRNSSYGSDNSLDSSLPRALEMSFRRMPALVCFYCLLLPPPPPPPPHRPADVCADPD